MKPFELKVFLGRVSNTFSFVSAEAVQPERSSSSRRGSHKSSVRCLCTPVCRLMSFWNKTWLYCGSGVSPK